MKHPSKIILFDGVCHLCNQSVLWILKRDTKNQFYFAPLQSELAETLLKNNLPEIKLGNTLIYYRNGILFTKSNAVLHIAFDLGFPYSFAFIFKLIPRFIRNFIYDFIAKNRYKWFGKYNQCSMPKPEWAHRFI